MPKKQIKKSVAKKLARAKTYSLKTWLFNRPIIFSLLSFGITIAICAIYAVFAAMLNINSTTPLAILLSLGFVWTIYYTIKKLPKHDMYRDDFIAITNGCSGLSILITLLSVMIIGYNANTIQYKLMWMYAFHPTILLIIAILAALLYLYMFGVMISNIYARYKRAVKIGISKYKVIASMPFGFFLTWIPGYLIPEKNQNTNIEIKTKWYSKFNKWVVANSNNTLFAFLMFVLLNNAMGGAISLLLTGFLLAIYALWNLKYKTTFMKNIDKYYALTAICINMAMLIAIILTSVTNM